MKSTPPPSATPTRRPRRSLVERPVERHDYEPGNSFHPMHTDPSCRVCGAHRTDHR